MGGVKFLAVDTSLFAKAAMQSVSPAFYFTQVSPAPHFIGIQEPMSMVTWDNILLVGANVPDETVLNLLMKTKTR
ncbi:hypothetical protein [Marinomonas mediterranea]|uniref:hypothetical protein n=1 Tax=Marinomonas mediterranea TaxID=119864 RepID=UPI00234A29D5|nr:hypothetical protein [Marinomonas mediterranea]